MMNKLAFPFLSCPLDGLPLTRQDNSVICTSGHNFDFDRKGTLNLLPVQFKKSRNPGDSKEMVLAREKFLNSGYYGPVSNTLNDLVAAHKADTILDAGCGEGYYTQRLAAYLKNAVIVGMDISKDAIHAAAKRSRDIQWIVGTNANIPLLPSSVDCVISLFGFPVWEEFRRILKPGGIVILGDSGPDHLIELRHLLYPEIKTKPESEKVIPKGFEAPEIKRLTQQINIADAEQVADLIAMTPHQHRATKERIAEAVQHKYDGITLDVVFSIYKVTL